MRKLAAFLIVLFAAVPLHAGTPSVFDGPRFVSTAGPVTDLAIADFDNDGKRDFIVGSGATLSVYRGNGDGTFALPVTTAFAAGGLYFEAALLDGDAFPDLILASGDAVHFYSGDGDGTFTAGMQFFRPLSCPVNSIRLAELTSDGRPDLVLCGSLHRNLDGGNFGSAEAVALGSGYFADANGDGKLDAFIDGGSGFWSLRLGNGNGTFQPAVQLPDDGYSTAGDFDADGRADYAWIDPDGNDLVVRLRQADGTYGARMSAGFVSERREVRLRTADLTGDGRADLIGTLPGRVIVSISNADGSPGPVQTYVASSGATSIAVADFNADGHPDALAAGTGDPSDSGAVTFLRGTPGGTFAAPRGRLLSTRFEEYFYDASPAEAAASDVTGDGELDAIVLVKGGIAVLPGTGEAHFATPIVTPFEGININAGSFDATYGDFTGDGAVDVVVPVFNTFTCLVANGDGTFRLGGDLTVGTGSSSPRIVNGDFNGDGDRDVAIDNGLGLNLVFGRGDGTFDAPVATGFEMPYGGTGLTGDVNGDGAGDLVLASTVLLGSTSGTFTELEYDAAGSPSALVDLDGDGHLDVVKYDVFLDTATIGILPGNGDGTFGVRRMLTASQRGGPHPLTRGLAGDFDADGNVDLAFGTTILLGDGAGAFDGYARFRYPHTLWASALGDFDGNGTPDLVAVDLTAGAVELIPTLTAESADLPLTVTITDAPLSSPAAEEAIVTVTGTGAGAFGTSGGVVVAVGGTVTAIAEMVNGTAYVRMRAYEPGTHSLTAAFGGDPLYAAATAAPRTIEITRAFLYAFFDHLPEIPTTLTPISVQGSLESAMPIRPTGNAVLTVDGVERGSGPVGAFDIAVGLLPAGKHTFVLSYAGDALHLPDTTTWTVEVIKPPALVSLAISPSPRANVGTSVTLTATFPNEPALSGGTVSFHWNGKLVASVPVAGGSASLTTSALEVGSGFLHAVYSGNETYRGSSKGVSYAIDDFPLETAARSFHLVEPCRILDTRGPMAPTGGPLLAAGGTRAIQISGVCGIPSGAAAVAMNVTVVAPQNVGVLTVFPGASPRPDTSMLNYRTGRTRANSAIMPLSAGGRLKVFNSGPAAVHVLIDVTGYFQ